MMSGQTYVLGSELRVEALGGDFRVAALVGDRLHIDLVLRVLIRIIRMRGEGGNPMVVRFITRILRTVQVQNGG